MQMRVELWEIFLVNMARLLQRYISRRGMHSRVFWIVVAGYRVFIGEGDRGKEAILEEYRALENNRE
jgi:hypothetical protein